MVVSYLLEVWEDTLPIPLDRGLGKLRTAGFCPGIVVVLRPTIEEHAIHGTASANNLTRLYERSLVPKLQIWDRVERPRRRSIRVGCDPICRRIKGTRGIMNVAILDDQDVFYGTLAMSKDTTFITLPWCSGLGTYLRGKPRSIGRPR